MALEEVTSAVGFTSSLVFWSTTMIGVRGDANSWQSTNSVNPLDQLDVCNYSVVSSAWEVRASTCLAEVYREVDCNVCAIHICHDGCHW